MGLDFITGAIILTGFYLLGDFIDKNIGINHDKDIPFMLTILTGMLGAGLLYLLFTLVSVFGALARTIIF